MMEVEVKLKKQTKEETSISPFQNCTVAVIGSGLVGKSWAIVFSRAGCKVKLYDSLPEAATKAIPTISQISADLHKVGLLRDCRSPQEVVDRISIASNLSEAVKDVFWVQECVPETVEAKTQIFSQLDQVAAENIILGSSTSAIPGSAFTKDLKTKNRCIVAHPVNPPHLIPLVEIVPSPFTSPEISETAMKFMEYIGQSPVLVKKEIHSFVLNRLQGALLNEAFRLVEDGVIGADDLDKTVRDGLGLRWSFMGPFETIDLNAPGGVKDYVDRYSGNMYEIAKQQADPRPWKGSVVENVVQERRSLLPLQNLPDRGKWRDARLMGLMSHKNQIEAAEKASKK